MKLRIRKGTRFLFDGQAHVVESVLSGNRFRCKNIEYGGEITLSHDEIGAAWGDGRIKFAYSGRNGRTDSDKALIVNGEHTDFSTVAEEDKAAAQYRFNILKNLYDFVGLKEVARISRADIKDFAESIGYRKGVKNYDEAGNLIPSAGTIERWNNFFVESNGSVLALIPHHKNKGGKGQSRLDADVENIIQTALAKYQARKKVIASSVDDVHTEIVNKIADENQFRARYDQLVPPHIDTVRYRILNAGIEMTLHPPKSRKQQQKDSPVGNFEGATRIGERYEIDHTQLDLFVVDTERRLPIGRPHVTAVKDKFTGLPTGWHIGFNKGGYKAVMLSLRHAFKPKPDYQSLYGTENTFEYVYGVCELLAVDRGKEFIGRSLTEACQALGIRLDKLPPRTPWYKGAIEKFFRDQNSQLLSGIPGFVPHNFSRWEEYDPLKHACISLEAFLQVFHMYIIDVYSQDIHRFRVQKGIPIEMWNHDWLHNGNQLPLTSTVDELDKILLPTDERAIQNIGIEFKTIIYQSSEAARLRSQYKAQMMRHSANDEPRRTSPKVLIKYDPEDMSKVYVPDPINSGEWITFYANDPAGYTKNLSLDQHKIIKDYANKTQEQPDIYQLARAKQRIQEIVEEEFHATKRIRRRERSARFMGMNSQNPQGTRLIPNEDISATKNTSTSAEKVLSKQQEKVNDLTDDTTEHVKASPSFQPNFGAYGDSASNFDEITIDYKNDIGDSDEY